jgi:Tfp pilus assembly protein PilN
MEHIKDYWPILIAILTLASVVGVALYRLRIVEATQTVERKEISAALEKNNAILDGRMAKVEAALLGIATLTMRGETTEKQIEDIARKFDAFTAEARAWNVAVLGAKVDHLEREFMLLRQRVHELAQALQKKEST